jgi:predicted XRE-type DNA-binding protein
MLSRNKGKAQEPEHITRGDVLDDLGFSPKKVASLKLKADLHDKVVKRATRHTQQELQTILQESQPRISDLLRGKLSKFSLEMLVFYAERLGMHAEIKTTPARKPSHSRMAASAR